MTKTATTKGEIKMAKNKTKKVNKPGATYKSIMKDSFKSVKVAVHNSFIGLIFVLVMFILCVFAIELTYTASGLAIGQATNGSFETVADIVVMVITIIMICGFVLFFTIKLDNMLIKAMTKRFWHIDKETNEIVKNNAKTITNANGDNSNNK